MLGKFLMKCREVCNFWLSKNGQCDNCPPAPQLSCRHCGNTALDYRGIDDADMWNSTIIELYRCGVCGNYTEDKFNVWDK